MCALLDQKTPGYYSESETVITTLVSMNIEWSELQSSYQPKIREYYSSKPWHDNGLINQKYTFQIDIHIRQHQNCRSTLRNIVEFFDRPAGPFLFCPLVATIETCRWDLGLVGEQTEVHGQRNVREREGLGGGVNSNRVIVGATRRQRLWLGFRWCDWVVDGKI
jgi:hypothetical protein